MTEQPSPDAIKTKGWLRRFLRRLDLHARRGDVIAGEVGEDARGVVIGKNIVQIGKLEIPLLPLLLLPLILIGGFAAAFFAFRGPTRMEGSFNVAVAEFGQEKPSGRVVSSGEGKLLSKWVYESLEAQKEIAKSTKDFADQDITSSLEIWQDSLPITEKGTRIGLVKNEADVPGLAERLGAQVLIYGNIDPHGNFIPKYYVSPLVHSGTDQILGHYAAGDTPERVDPAALGFAKTKVTERTDPLLWLALGLQQEQFGFAEKALKAFKQGAVQATGDPGEDILHYFVGDAALFLAQQGSGFNEKLASEAEDAFKQALRINPDSVRAHIGIGLVDLYRAYRGVHLEPEAAQPYLEKALQEHQLALQLASKSNETELKVLATLALAQSNYLQGGAFYVAGKNAEAEAAFDQAIHLIESVSPDLNGLAEPRLAGLAYQTLGTAYKQKARMSAKDGDKVHSLEYYQQAREAYSLCIEQGKAGVFDEILTKTVIEGVCVPLDKESQQAMQSLEGGQ